MRKKIIAGNWKMNFGPVSTSDYFHELLPMISSNPQIKDKINGGEISIELYVPSISLFTAMQSLSNSDVLIKIGAQNISDKLEGAYTGEISVNMLSEISIKASIIGHSERRHIYKETNSEINKKIITAMSSNLDVIFCIGETLEERNSGTTIDIISEQITTGLANVNIDNNFKDLNLIIAYEPVWAIGTGLTASSADAQQICQKIRELISDKYGEIIAHNIHILYGGSVKSNNTKDLLSQADIDGLLIGGASLKPDIFFSIIENSL
ncbi:MAG: triose-phosphate isomerase [Synergistaceae bacterium]